MQKKSTHKRLFDSYHSPDMEQSITRTQPLDRWEEHMMQPNDPTLHATERGVKGPLTSLYVLLAIVAVLLVGRLGFINLMRGDYFESRSENNFIRKYVTRSIRGAIYDRDSQLLVRNIPRNDAAVIPADLPRDEIARDRLFTELSELLDVPVLEIADRVSANEFYYLPVILRENIPHDIKLAMLEAFPDNESGVVIVEDFYREYLSGPAYAHVLGYMGKIRPDELSEYPALYSSSSEVGRTGTERAYESELRGHDGIRTVHINAQGKVVDVLATSDAVDGCDLTLHIDSELQQRSRDALQAMARNAGSGAGAVVVMDPRSGAILSLVSLPDFDNTIFANGLTGDEVEMFDDLSQDAQTPFLNRAISGMYPPGSTFKLVTASAALAERVVSPLTELDAPGSISIENQFFPGQFFVYKDWNPSGHGALNIYEAIAESADTFFYKVAGGFEDLAGLGVNRMKHYSERFGLGQALGIDLPGEVAGVVPDDVWKRAAIDEGWYTGDTYNLGIGQGFLLTTPLQVAAFTSVVANGGTLYQPQIVDSITKCDRAADIQPAVITEHVISPDDIRVVQEGMRLAITGSRGTGKALNYYPIDVAGKTGTAQFNNNEQEHAWFTVYAPYDNPEVVVTVLVEAGGEGSEVALPVARQVLDAYFSGNER